MGCAAETPAAGAADTGAAAATDNAAGDIALGESVPALRLTGRVVDTADILEQGFETELTRKLERFEADTGAQLVVVTVADLGGEDIAVYTRNLGNSWGIGDEMRNDRLILLIAPNERKVRIEVSIGLEETVTNAEAQMIINNDLLPSFAAGNFDSGVEAGVDSMMRELTQLEDAA